MIFTGVSFARELGALEQYAEAPKVYLPGDIVQVIVGAPPDTVQLSADMPDKTRVKLNYERRNSLWRGAWEVPMRMKKGTFTAKLEAMDVEGKMFYGETAPFIIAEPTLITLIDMVSVTGESRSSRKIIKVEEIVVEEQPKTVAIKVKKKAPVAAAKKHFYAPKPVVAAKPKPEPKPESSIDVEDIVAARYYMAKQDYVKAKERLKVLNKKAPDNKQIKALIQRVDQIIKAGGKKN